MSIAAESLARKMVGKRGSSRPLNHNEATRRARKRRRKRLPRLALPPAHGDPDNRIV